MNEILTEFLIKTLIRNPIYEILVTILGSLLLYAGPISKNSGVLFGVGISMLAGSGWYHFTSWKKKRTSSTDEE